MKIERKISFIVAGIEFETLQVAKFFQIAIKRDMQVTGNDDPRVSADDLLAYWGTVVHIDHRNHAAEIVNIIMNLQLPKLPRKEKPLHTTEFNFELLPEEDNPPN